MSKILLKGRPYGGSTTVTDALHLLTKDTLNTDVSAQNMLTNILGDMAQLETSTAATKAYAKGEYLVLGSYFYKVTATIDPGDTLTVGTNIERTNVGAEMKLLQPKIKYKDVEIASITITGDGYISIIDKFPSGMNNFLYAIVWDYGNSAKYACFDVNAAGNFIRGAGGDTLTTVTIRYFYTD